MKKPVIERSTRPVKWWKKNEEGHQLLAAKARNRCPEVFKITVRVQFLLKKSYLCILKHLKLAEL